jgi:hypothetical protein
VEASRRQATRDDRTTIQLLAFSWKHPDDQAHNEGARQTGSDQRGSRQPPASQRSTDRPRDLSGHRDAALSVDRSLQVCCYSASIYHFLSQTNSY